MDSKTSKKANKKKAVKEEQAQGDAAETTQEEEKYVKIDKKTQKEKNLKLYNKFLKRSQKKIVFDTQLIKNAAKVIKQYAKHQKEKNALDLLGNEDKFITVNILLSEVPTQYSPKPLRIPIPHPIYGAKYDTRACLFIKDPEREFLDKIEDMDVPCLAKCIPYKTLKKEFERYHDKKDLINEYDLFFSDITLYKMLPKPLGKIFYVQKKFPHPANLHKLEGAELETSINDLFNQTYFHIRNGPNYTLRVARTSMKTKEIAENVISAVHHALPYIMMHDGIKQNRVQSISLRLGDSFDVPIFNQLLNTEIASYLLLKQQEDENGELPKEEEEEAEEEAASSDSD
ncbi:unnamed protein product [Moneuplotes crassus]|uniref:Ribosomal protein L1 n=1 Tax=Euplotes crassus TaxID=5936 RepID=A0AAD1USE0_EUPCR|nr:unnamed protein product [Moneuplotes crassus]